MVLRGTTYWPKNYSDKESAIYFLEIFLKCLKQRNVLMAKGFSDAFSNEIVSSYLKISEDRK